MTEVGQTPSSHDRHVFASVFGSYAELRPQTRRKTLDVQPSLSVADLSTALQDVSRHALGIGDDDFECTIHDNTGKEVASFLSAFLACPPPAEFDGEGNRDLSNHVARWAELSIWKDLPKWKRSFGTITIERQFARAVDQLITEFITWSYASTYENSVMSHLRFWVTHVLSVWIEFFRGKLRNTPTSTAPSPSPKSSDNTVWHRIALARLADLRISELFDIVIAWDSTSSAIEDLRHFTTNPATRSYLTNEFATLLSQRLLHPAASTIEILQVYISMIRSFRKLDPRGVLLERVARKVRRYLRDREDTVRVVVAGLLSDVSTEQDQSNPEVLHELALELQQREHGSSQHADGELDWNNMEWMPDPVDAAPDYMKSKNTDVIGSLMSLFESKDILVRELQTVLADRLLMDNPDFDQEISVVEHLKIRFGDSALQGCEVMLKDVLDSRKVDNVIRKDQHMDSKSQTDSTELHAKILSRLFWPALQEQDFKVPPPILTRQNIYERGFEALKQTRKLTWLNAIGQVDVELELDDRTFQGQVLPYQATVIYAFQEADITPTSTSQPVTRSVSTLSADLNMSAALVRSACHFWTSSQILHEPSRDTFAVLDTLPTTSIHPSSSTTHQQTSTSTSPSKPAATTLSIPPPTTATSSSSTTADRRVKMSIYTQFITSMLTNGGAMPITQIAMMLGIVVPGGFPYGMEELRDFLAGMVKDGKIEVGGATGGVYRVRN